MVSWNLHLISLSSQEQRACQHNDQVCNKLHAQIHTHACLEFKWFWMCRVSAHFCEAHLLPGWWIATRGLPAHVPPLTAGSFLPLHMRKMCDLYMIVGTISDFNFFFLNITSMFTCSPVKLRQNTKFHCAERWCPKMTRSEALVVLIGFLALAWWKK